ncbi:MAG: hypothetical protein IJ289_04710 [Clostridia bacterium]|nr:hypothetical protein [Clostridia bacterium]
MAKRMKDYQIFKCPFCRCDYYDSTARDGKKVGNPMIECPQCGKKSYRKTILEPALISEKRYFDIRYSSLYGNLRIGLILIYAVFLFFILVTMDMVLSMCFIASAILLFVMYLMIRMFHKRNVLRSKEYEKEITRSLERLSDTAYAAMVIKTQGMDADSVYFYELHQNK